MNVYITSGIGTGSNLLSAFDDALFDSGVCNYNLIYLSSVIPPNTEIVEIERFDTPEEDFGKRLYVVRAEESSDIPGMHLATAVGWYQFEEGKNGFFVEHHAQGNSPVSDHVINNVKVSLQELCERRGLPFDVTKVGYKLTETVVGDKPTCAITLAVFKSENW